MVAGRRPPVFHTPGPRPEYSKPLAQKPKLNSRTLLQCQLLMDVEGIEDRSSPKTNPRGPADSLPQLSHDRNSSPRDRIRSGSGESASSLSPITHVRNSIAFNQTPPNTNPEDLCSFAEMFHDPTNTRATGSSEMENDQGHNYAPELCSSPPQLPKLQNAQVANRAHERFHEMARTHTNLSSAHGAANGRHDDLAFQPLAPFGEPPDVGYDHMSLQPSAPVGVPVQTPWNVTGPIHMPNDQMAVQAQSPGASSRGPSIAPSAQDTLESQAPADSEPQLVTINFEVRLPNGETIMASAQVPAHTQVPNGLAVVTPAHLPSGQDASRSSQEPANMHPQLPSLPMNSPIWLPDSSMIATADPEAQKPSSQGSLPSSPPPAIEELKFRKVPVEFRGRPMTPGYHRAASPFENDAHHLVSQVPVNQRLNNALGIQSILLAKPDEILRVDDLNLPQMPGMGSAVLSYSGDYVEPVQPMGMDYGDLFGVRTAVLDEVDDDAPRALDMGDAELLGMGTAKLDNVNYEPGRALEMSDVDMELFFDFDAAAAPDTSPSPPLSMGDAELVDLTVDAPTSNASTSKFSTTNAYTLNALESVFLPQMGDPDFDHFKALADRINGLDGPLKKASYYHNLRKTTTINNSTRKLRFMSCLIRSIFANIFFTES